MVTTACSEGSSTSPGAQGGGVPQVPVRHFAGAVDGTDAFIAFAMDGSKTLAYVCDGETVAEWYHGPAATQGPLALVPTAPGTDLVITAELVGGAVAGSVRLPGDDTDHTFSAQPATGGAGLYRATGEKDGSRYVGGWIQLAGGEQRGAVRTIDSELGTVTTLARRVVIDRPDRPIRKL